MCSTFPIDLHSAPLSKENIEHTHGPFFGIGSYPAPPPASMAAKLNL